jgi:hypothetical protein
MFYGGAKTMSDGEGTEIKTMWSESLLETLYVALRKDKEDALVQEIIVDLRAKDYDDEYLINKVKKKVGPNAAVRIKKLLAGKVTGGSGGEEKPLSKADQARANAAAKRRQENPGLMGKIKGIFGSGN